MSHVPDSLRKAAVLVAALDTHSADVLLEQLPAEHAARLRRAVMELDQVDADEQERVLQEFLAQSPKATASRGVELATSLAGRAAASRTENPSPQPKPFRLLNEVEPSDLVRVLAHQHPQITAVVLAHLAPSRAVEVLAFFSPEMQVELLRRIAELDDAEPEIMRDLEQQLESLFVGVLRGPRQAGLAAVRQIFHAADHEKRRLLYEQLRKKDRQLATQLVPEPPRQPPQTTSSQDSNDNRPAETSPAPEPAVQSEAPPPGERVYATASWTFDEVMYLDDQDLGRLLSRAEPTDVLLALAGAEPAFVARVQRALPARQARKVKRGLRELQPLLVSDIEVAQRRLVMLARQLASAGILTASSP